MQTVPVTKIIEQPAQVIRFRYQREGHGGGLIVGVSTTSQNKTYPTVYIEGYQGRALVIASCVTKEEPYRPHPHKLVGREGARKGVRSMEVSPETMTAEFVKLGIQCMRRKDVEDSLKIRKEIRVDPFRTGFEHHNYSNFDLAAVRLCFQVLLQDAHGEFTIPLAPVVSEPIYDKRTVSELAIVKLSKCNCPVNGVVAEDIILVCDKVLKNDIEVRFYEEHNGEVVWEGLGIFQPSDVYKQLVISFKPPCYKTLSIREPVKVFIQLRRPSDGQTSEPRPFEFLPLESELRKLNRIQQKPINLLRNFSVPPLPKQEQNVANLFPEFLQMYDNINRVDLPNPITPQQQQYLLTNKVVTPELPDLHSHFSNVHLNEPSTSDTSQHSNGGRVGNLVYMSTGSSSSQQDYSTELLNSLSPPTNPDSNFQFPTTVEDITLSQSDTAKNPIIAGMETNLSGLNFSDMDIQPINNLSGLLNEVNNQHSELRLLNLDSGELDAMNIST